MLRLLSLREHFTDVSIEPETLELLQGHVACSIDATTAVGRAAEAVKCLCHGPLGRWVEEGEFITSLDALWTSEEGHGWNIKDQAWITAVVDVNQISVQVQVLISAHLYRSVCWLVGLCRWWKVDLGIQSIWGDIDSGDGLGGELGVVDDHFLDLRVGWLWPERNEWCHCVGVG